MLPVLLIQTLAVVGSVSVMLDPYVWECSSLCGFMLALAKRRHAGFGRQKWSSNHIPRKPTWWDAVMDRCRGASRCHGFQLVLAIYPGFLSDHWSCWPTVVLCPLGTPCGGLREVIAAQEHCSHRPLHEPYFHNHFYGCMCLASWICLAGYSHSGLSTFFWTFTWPPLLLIVWNLTPITNFWACNWW